MSANFIVYQILLADGETHAGITTDLNRRILLHNSGTVKHLPSYANNPVQLLDQEIFHDVLSAKNRLLAIKTNAAHEIALKKVPTADKSIAEPNRKKKEQSAIGIPICYHPNLAYFSKLIENDNIVFDTNERFEKQTYRNRATILSANGILNLTVPVIRPQGKNTHIQDVLISRAENWEKNHIRAIKSAYSKAPFYVFYASEIFAIIEGKHARLIDLNLSLIKFYLAKLGVQNTIDFEHSKDSTEEIKSVCLPKNRNSYNGKTYIQAFHNKYDFEGNLSILDLLFCEGPNAINLLKS